MWASMGFLDEAGLRRLWDRVKGLVGIPTKRALTQAEYEALSEEEKAADVLYLITDGNGGGGSVTSFKVEKVLIPKNTEAGTVIKSSVLYRTNSGDNIEPVVAIPQAGQEDWFEDGKITWKVIVQYSFVDDSYSYVVEVTVNTPPTYDAQLNVFYVEPGF